MVLILNLSLIPVKDLTYVLVNDVVSSLLVPRS